MGTNELRCKKCNALHGVVKRTVSGDVLEVKGRTNFWSDGEIWSFRCSSKDCTEILKHSFKRV